MNPVQKFLGQVRYDDLPPEVRAQAVRCLYDLIGCAAAGSQTALARIISRHAIRYFAAPATGPAARPLLGGDPISPVGAALVGGMIIDAIDAHDGHPLTKGHVGCALLPSLAAVSEAENLDLSGPEFLSLLVAGYEIGTRLGMGLHATATDYHTSGAWNAVSCAALTAFLLKLNASQFEHALGIAEYHGPRSQMMRGVDHPTMLKDGSGWGAMAGVSAGYLAADGFTGAPALTVVSNQLSELWNDLGERWRIMEQYFKPYPCCRWAHPAIDAALSLKQAHPLDPQAIESVTVHTFHEATRLNQKVPRTTEQAQYAINFPIAVALVHGRVNIEDIDGEGLRHPLVNAVCERVSLIEDAQYNARFPAQRWAHVTVALKNGERLVSAPITARGDPENPLTDELMVEKYFALSSPTWGKPKATAVLAAVQALRRPNSRLSQLLEALRRP
jgi:2-methylcitrate dehydratase PrpD